ncbi:MAG: hypothetical protein CMH53_04610 [Myxococcales bacterium]|nr:hypothetical protein [Myxococcales bacterium]
MLFGCGAEPTSNPTDTHSSQTPLQGWQVLADEWAGGALASAWAPATTDIDSGWVLVGGDGTTGVILELIEGQWQKWSIEQSGQLWWVHGDAQGRRVAVGDKGTVVSWARGDETPTVTQLTAFKDSATALYGVWFGSSSDEIWLVGGAPLIGPGSGKLVRLSRKVLTGKPLSTSDYEEIDLADELGVLFKIIGTPDGQLWAVGDGGQIWHRNAEKWTLEATIDTDVLIGIAGGAPDQLVVVGGRGTGVVARRDATGWQIKAGAVPDSWIPGLSAVIALDEGRALVAGNYGFVGEQSAQTPRNELPSLEPPLTSMTLHGGFGTTSHQVMVGGTFENPSAPRRGCVLVRGSTALPALP